MKKFLCAILVLSMILLNVSPALALSPNTDAGAFSDEMPELDDGLPVIVVQGLDVNGVSIDPGNGVSRPLLEVDTGTLLPVLFNVAKSSLFGADSDKALDSILDYAGDLLQYVNCDEDGEPIYPSTAELYPLSINNYPNLLAGESDSAALNTALAAVERYGAERTYFFSYDWRRNPMRIADDLNTMVLQALADSGQEQVNIICSSLGGMHTLAYFTEFGYDNVNSCVFFSSAFYGSYMASDLMSGRIEFSGETLANFMINQTKGNFFGSFFVKVFKALGIFNYAASSLNSIMDTHKERLSEELLRDLAGYLTPFWALTLPEDYDAALDFLFGDTIEENADFIAITEEVQEMLAGRDDLLRAAAADGVGVAVVAGYNSPAVPLYTRSDANGDGTLETARMTGGGIVAPYGKTLGDDYVAENPAKLSPDGVVDLSPCLFPEYTWVVKDALHAISANDKEYTDFLFWLIGFDGQPTVESNPLYPQFLYTDAEFRILPQ